MHHHSEGTAFTVLDLKPALGMWKIRNGWLVGKRKPKALSLRIDEDFIFFDDYSDALRFQRA